MSYGQPPPQQNYYGGPPPQQQPPPQPNYYGGQPNQPPPPGQSYGGQPNQQPPPGQGYGAPPNQQPPPGQNYYGGPPPQQPPHQQPPPQQNYYGGPPPQQPPQQYGQPPAQQGYYGQPPYGAGGQPAYGQPPGGYQQPGMPGVDPDSQAWFMAVDHTGRGRITAHELREALINPSGGRPFDAKTCNMLVRMFDKNGDGTIDCPEFCALRNYITQWKAQFDRVDNNRSGNIGVNDFMTALQQMGHQLSPAFGAAAFRTYGTLPQRQLMDFDAFISSCALIHTLSRVFSAKQQPPQQQPTGSATFAFEEYIRVVFEHVLAD